MYYKCLIIDSCLKKKVLLKSGIAMKLWELVIARGYKLA